MTISPTQFFIFPHPFLPAPFRSLSIQIKAHQLATVVLAQQKQIIAIKTSIMPDDWKEDYEAKKKALQKAAKAARAEVLQLRHRIAQLENQDTTTDNNTTIRDAYSIKEDYGAQKALIIALEQLRVSQLTISDLQSQVSNLQAQLTLTRQALEAKDVEISVMNRESGLESPTVSSSSASVGRVDDSNKNEKMMVLMTELTAARNELNASCDEILLLKCMLQDREGDMKKEISEKELGVALNIKDSSSDIAEDKSMVDKKKKNDSSKKKRRPNFLGRICFVGTVIAATVAAAIHHK